LKLLFSIFLLCSLNFQAFCQDISLDYSNLPLNEVLLDLSARYNLQVSINATTSSACKITIKQKFVSEANALQALADQCNLAITMVGEVYSFIAIKPVPSEKERDVYYHYQGEVFDEQTAEFLPYASIKIGSNELIADENGRFNLRSKNPYEQIKIKYLGYYLKDSLAAHSNGLAFGLKSQNLQLSAVIIDTSNYAHLSQIGDQSGKTKFNDITKALIPGGNNNWMFNYLRLYPGIMAAGESVSDYIIWGSYSGQNHIIFDGITLFNSISVSNEIGRVNPSIIKSLDVYKGGYNVDVGDRTGGVLLINGKVGNKQKVTGSLNLNNQIANLYLDIPLFKNTSSLQLSARKSYVLLGLKKFRRQEENFINPEFDFTDFNLKFTTKFKNNDLLQISSIASKDQYSASFEKKQGKNYSAALLTGSDQIGTSLKYVHNSKRSGISTITFAHSNYLSYSLNEVSFKDSLSTSEEILRNNDWSNNFNEYSVKYHHNFNTFKRNTFQMSFGYIRNEFNLKLNESLGSFTDINNYSDRFSGFVKDKIQVHKRFNLALGLKLDMPFNSLTPYIQPRINGLVNLTDRINFTFGSGLYYQFASQATIVDSLGSESSFWLISDGVEVPVQSAVHNVAGFSFTGARIEVGLDGYYKMIDGLSRFYSESSSEAPNEGSAIAFGSDLYLKFRLKKHEIWTAYSIGKVEETFNYNDILTTSTAPQNQLHELKIAGVFNFHPFYFSAASVFGSGIRTIFEKEEFEQERPYLRTDIAFQYKFKTKKLNFETGFSIVNVFNNLNVRISEFTAFPDGMIAATRATRFTPSIFFNVNF
jgi:hypothetical protein